MNRIVKVKAVLFDLDGTLVDTARAIQIAINKIRNEHNLQPITYAEIKQPVGQGTDAIIQHAFGLESSAKEFTIIKNKFLEAYYNNIFSGGDIYPGIIEVIKFIHENNLTWGIVTNKSTYLTMQLLSKIPAFKQPACVVCGDTYSERKPSSIPLLNACKIIKIQPSHTIYVGDTKNDAVAATNAKIRSISLTYGYESYKNTNYADWPTDFIAQNAFEIIDILRKLT